MAAVGVVGGRGGRGLRLALYTAAISGCFLAYSLIQERVMTLPWGRDGERFRHSLFIILVNRLVTCGVAAATLAALRQPLAPSAPIGLFAVPALANLLGSAAQYEALKYVSFPLQALAKCAKTVGERARREGCVCMWGAGMIRGWWGGTGEGGRGWAQQAWGGVACGAERGGAPATARAWRGGTRAQASLRLAGYSPLCALALTHTPLRPTPPSILTGACDGVGGADRGAALPRHRLLVRCCGDCWVCHVCAARLPPGA